MTSAAVLAAVGAFVLAAVIWTWILAPLFHGASTVPPADPRMVALLAEREAAVAELRDLERDHADGRIRDDDYRRMREEVVVRGARILAALDRLASRRAGAVSSETERLQAEVERRLEPRPEPADATPIMSQER